MKGCRYETLALLSLSSRSPLALLSLSSRSPLALLSLSSRSPLALLSLTLLVGGGLVARPVWAQTTVYNNNFTGGAGAEWSNNITNTTPGTASHAADKFLGEFGHQTTTLTLDNLAANSEITVSFDLYMIRSMDGNGPVDGPDPWALTENGNTLISTNFANFAFDGNTQSFGGANGLGGYLTGGTYAPYTGATEARTLGYTHTGSHGTDDEDSVYHLSFTFADPSNVLALNFIGGQNQDITDESWGLDNVVVKTNATSPVPEASTTVSFGLLLVLGLGGVMVAARKKTRAA